VPAAETVRGAAIAASFARRDCVVNSQLQPFIPSARPRQAAPLGALCRGRMKRLSMTPISKNPAVPPPAAER
jgi:hypothetical protein